MFISNIMESSLVLGSTICKHFYITLLGNNYLSNYLILFLYFVFFFQHIPFHCNVLSL